MRMSNCGTKSWIVVEKNKEHNLKHPASLLLLDKQGLLCAGAARDAHHRFRKISDLYELAMLCRAFLTGYSELRSRNEDLADFLLYRLRSWVDEPDMVFSESVSTREAWILLLSELGVRGNLHRKLNDPGIVSGLAQKKDNFSQFATTWWEYPDFAYRLSRAIDESRNLGLDFVDDSELRRLVAADYAEAKKAFQAKLYKATIVLSGSIVEALLVLLCHKAGGSAEALRYFCSWRGSGRKRRSGLMSIWAC